jgi:hypothetical protein
MGETAEMKQQLANLCISPISTVLTWGNNNQPICSYVITPVVTSKSEDKEDGRNVESEDISVETVHIQELTMVDILHGYNIDDVLTWRIWKRMGNILKIWIGNMSTLVTNKRTSHTLVTTVMVHVYAPMCHENVKTAFGA